MKVSVAIAALCIACTSCRQNDSYKQITSDPLLYSKTVKKLNDIVLENNFPPMTATRNYVYANIAAYECIVAGDSNYVSLSGQIQGMPAMPALTKDQEVDYRFAALLALTKVGNAVTFPEGSMIGYYEELIHKAEDAGMPDQILENSKAYADTVFSAIMGWAKADHYAQTRSASKFTVTDEDGRWVPTPPSYASALEAHWMEIRTLILDSAGACKPAPAPHFTVKDQTSVFYRGMMEVKQTIDSLSDAQKHIADFWDDNPFKMNVSGHVMFATKKFSPGGHWMNIVGIASQKAGSDFNTTVYAYTKTAIALFDGFISCWEEKYRSNLIRPETVINKYIDADWRPYIQTPPFPSYTSGHSVISAAAAEVLTDVYGDHFSYTDTSEIEFGIPHRSFTSFREAAMEASVSRMYGGIHYRFDLDEGNKQGACVGKMVIGKLNMRRRVNKNVH